LGRSRRIPFVEWEALDVLVDMQVLICIVVLNGDVDVYTCFMRRWCYQVQQMTFQLLVFNGCSLH